MIHKEDRQNIQLVADWKTLMRTFIRPENEATRSTLLKYMEQILFGLQDFLGDHVGITEEASLKELAQRFEDTRISRTPEKKLAGAITDLVEDIAPHAVNVASPYFIGHMTAAIPFFMVHLKTIVTALNQNVVKLETSKVVSIIEKQVLAKLHRMLFDHPEAFYTKHVQHSQTTLGGFVEDGTLANITALWVARNKLLEPCPGFAGVEAEGVAAGLKAHGLERCVALVSRLGHYSLQKAGGVLGIGNRNIIAIDVDTDNRIDLNKLKQTIAALRRPAEKTGIVAVIGIAGTTETGTIDPLPELGRLCAENNIHFHVDAAWGGPTIMSDRYRHLLDGISSADSIIIDGHKQFYMPMTCGMVFFKDPQAMDAVVYHAKYINRPGSVDLGIKSLPGSREASSLILDSALKIMGSQGYAILIEHGIETAQKFAEEINRRADFELITPPRLNILTYRLHPETLRRSGEGTPETERLLNEINKLLQRLQREAGRSFVSRTTLNLPTTPGDET
ncbi:MAG: aminotransferase class V-fold PLP-dependent enzyme, partial [Desulfobacterales bacterium]|nr:aminotransferase class V-fold PLP-dependent enzyme [Desulfobacterales bacterium]